MELKEELFCISLKKDSKSILVTRPSSILNPTDNSVMFLMSKMRDYAYVLDNVHECLVFVEERITISDSALEQNLIEFVKEPRLEYCRFFRDHNIKYLPKKEKYRTENGSFICDGASIGENTVIMPGCYIGEDVGIGSDCYIGCGTKLVGRVDIGNDVIIRENSVIGANGLSTDRDRDGKAITMPQFGGVRIGNRVEIGANVVIARGAIDDTVICDGCKIDNSTFISHNVRMGGDTFVVGETIMFGSSQTGKGVFISGNSTVRNKAKIGDGATVGMGSVVTKDVGANKTVMGNPAREK